MSYLLLYIPICLVILTVLEACKQDDPGKIARASLINSGILTGVLLGSSILVYALQSWL